jgi:hypothetical protein
MGVEAFDPRPGSSDPAGRPGTTPPFRHVSVPFPGVSRVGSRQRQRIDLGLGGPHTPVGLEAVHGQARSPADQPIPGRHRRSVIEEGRILDHHRVARAVAHYDCERALGWTAKQAGHPFLVSQARRRLQHELQRETRRRPRRAADRTSAIRTSGR